MAMSFEEKSVWVQLVGVAVGLGAYFMVASQMMAAGVTELVAFVPLFAASVVFMVALLVAGMVAAAVTGRVEKPDERDRLIAWRAEANSSWLLAVGVLTGLTGMVLSYDDVWVAHVLLGSLYVSEGLGFVLRIVYYRRGV